jgi:hypothetical protein
MNRSILQRTSWANLFAAGLLFVWLTAARCQSEPETGKTNAPLSLIVMEDVPLRVAIQELARQANLNIIIDPGVLASPVAAGPGTIRIVPAGEATNQLNRATNNRQKASVPDGPSDAEKK